MKEILHSDTFIVILTIGSYYIGTLINSRVNKPFTNPLLIALILIIPTLLLLDIDYPTYEKGSHIISFMLGPTVVALGYILHKQIAYLHGNIRSILISVSIGSIVGVVSVLLICWLFDCPREVMISMEPKSVTMPIALAISERSNGILAMTAITVFVCGIFGSVVGPWVLKVTGIKSKVAKGLALGAAAHGVGTSRAIQMGQVEGAFAGMAIALMGILTAIVIPIIESIWKM
ncbi:MAG: LrgB family protein [Bacteroidales bacterium]|nr:LrgB family protein [Bacteroidales bacterium]